MKYIIIFHCTRRSRATGFHCPAGSGTAASSQSGQPQSKPLPRSSRPQAVHRRSSGRGIGRTCPRQSRTHADRERTRPGLLSWYRASNIGPAAFPIIGRPACPVKPAAVRRDCKFVLRSWFLVLRSSLFVLHPSFRLHPSSMPSALN